MGNARVPSGRADSNRRPSGSRRRREVQIDWAPPQEAFDFGPAQEVNRYTRTSFPRQAEAAAGDEGVDELHPRDA